MSHNSEINDIVRTVQEHWIAVTPGYACACGHEHHGRQLVRGGRVSTMVPQYGFCDNDLCPCTTLKRVGA